MKRQIVPLALLALAAVAPRSDGAELPRRSLTIRQHTITVEVTSTVEQRATGLMRRFSLPPDHGMLFVFDRPQPLAFWMKNTYIPLSIAFIDSDGRIVNIEDMKPLDESTHQSTRPAVYALEMRQGWFASRGIGPGDVVTGLPPPSTQ